MGILARLFRRSQIKDGFLDLIKKAERSAVSNLNPVIYRTILREKAGHEAPTIISTDETDLDLVRRLPPQDIEVLCKSVESGQRGDEAASEGDLEDAARHYRDAFERNPYNDLALMSYGVALAQQGQLREGIEWVEKALKVNPQNERARNNLKAMRSEL
jgi:tetratricopeptide (TPR) repeat protein